MKINIKATGIELTSAINDYVQKKVGSLEKYLAKREGVVVQVEVGKSTKHHKSGDVFRAEAHLVGGGLNLYAASEQADLYAAIDLMKDDVVHKLTHLKGRKMALARRGAQALKNMMRGFNPFRKRD